MARAKNEQAAQRGRRLNEFPKARSYEDRLNPNSIRRVIYDVIRSDFDGDVSRAVKDFEEARQKPKNRKYKTDLKQNSYYNIVRDERQASYFHLEAIAFYLGIPVGVLLTYTRFYAEQNEDENAQERSIALLRGLTQILIHCSERLIENNFKYEKIDYSDLKTWIRLYHNQPVKDGANGQTQIFPDLAHRDDLDKLKSNMDKLSGGSST